MHNSHLHPGGNVLFPGNGAQTGSFGRKGKCDDAPGIPGFKYLWLHQAGPEKTGYWALTSNICPGNMVLLGVRLFSLRSSERPIWYFLAIRYGESPFKIV